MLQVPETPCLVVDVAKVRENVGRMQQQVEACGCRLRPHVKTHKLPFFARMQLEAGAAGITCAKVSEAEVMAQGGVKDIFIAYPMVGEFRIRRALALQRQVDRLILAVDSWEGAQRLSQAAVDANTVLEVRLEVDTGAKRTGIPRERLVELGKAVHSLPGLRLTGIYTFKSLVLHDAPTQDNAAAAQEEGELMASLAELLRQTGIPLEDVSADSTPTGLLIKSVCLSSYIISSFALLRPALLCTGAFCMRENFPIVSSARKSFTTSPSESISLPDAFFPLRVIFFFLSIL